MEVSVHLSAAWSMETNCQLSAYQFQTLKDAAGGIIGTDLQGRVCFDTFVLLSCTYSKYIESCINVNKNKIQGFQNPCQVTFN